MSVVDAAVDMNIDFKLKAATNPEAQADANLLVTWCVDDSESLVEYLRSRQIYHPYVLLVSGYKHTHTFEDGTVQHECLGERRKLVPLEDGATYLSFSRPGENLVLATVVYGDSIKEMHKKLLKKSGNSYDYRVVEFGDIGFDTTAFTDFGSTKRLEAQDTLKVIVPQEMFAKEPPRWVTNYLSLFLIGRTGFDQCSLRKRVVFTMPFLPLMLVLNLLFKLVCTVGLTLWGSRGISYKALLHPTAPPYRVWQNVSTGAGPNVPGSGTIFFTKKDGSARIEENEPEGDFKYVFKCCLALMVFPPVLLTGMAVMTVGITQSEWPIWWLVFSPLVLPGALLILGACMCTFIFVKDDLPKLRLQKRAQKAAKATPQQIEIDELYRQLELLGCETNQATPVAYENLPQQYKTVHLRYLNFKAKRCKPFAS